MKKIQFNKDKKLFSKWIVSFFLDDLSILQSSQYTCRIEPSDYFSFSFITWLYHSKIHVACMDFNSDNLDHILTSVGSFPFLSCVNTWSANQSLYLFWMNAFAAFFTDKSNGRNLRLWGTITTSQLFSAHSFFNVSLSCPLKVSTIIKACCSNRYFLLRLVSSK